MAELLIFNTKELIGAIVILKALRNGNLFPNETLGSFCRTAAADESKLDQHRIHKSMLQL